MKSNRKRKLKESFSKEFIEMKQRMLKNRAKREYRDKLARIVIDQWKFVARKGLDRIKADRFYAQNVKSRCFAVMVEKFGNSTRKPGMNDHDVRNSLWQKKFIVQMRGKFLQQQRYFTKWRDALLHLQAERKEEVRKQTVAEDHYLRTLIDRPFQLWKRYVQYRKEKNRNMEKAYMFVYHKSLEKGFHAWRKYIEIRKQRRAEKLYCDQWYAKYLMKRTIGIWHFALKDREELNIKLGQAIEFRNYNLKVKTLEYFGKLRYFKERRIRHEEMLQDFRRLSLKRWALRSMKSNYCKLVKERLRSKEEKAHHHFHQAILKYTLNCWIDYWKGKKHEKKMMEASDEFFFQHSGLRMIRQWKEYVNYRKEKQRLKDCADDFHHTKVLERYFLLWVKRTSEKFKLAKAIDDAIDYHEFRLLLHSFNHWKNYISMKKSRTKEKQRAMQIYQLSLKLKFLHVWKDKATVILKERETWEMACHHSNLLAAKHCLNSWKEYIIYRRLKHEKEDERVEECKEKLRLLKLRRFFEHLKKWYDQKIRNQLNKSRADKHRKVCVCNHYLLLWKKATDKKTLKKIQLRQAERHFEKVEKGKFFGIWKDALKEINDERRKMEEAEKAHLNAIKRKYYSLWRRYIEILNQEKAEKQEALNARSEFLLKVGVASWLSAGIKKRGIRMKFLNSLSMEKQSKYELIERCFRRWKYRSIESHRNRLFEAKKPRIGLGMFSVPKRLPKNIYTPQVSDDIWGTPVIKRPEPRRPFGLLARERDQSLMDVDVSDIRTDDAQPIQPILDQENIPIVANEQESPKMDTEVIKRKEKLQQEIRKITQTLQKIKVLKEKFENDRLEYSVNQTCLEQYSQESEEYHSLLEKKELLETRIYKFQEFQKSKIVPLREVLKKKIQEYRSL